MERKLPIIMLEGTAFTVDVARAEFREVARPRNTISFELMIRDGDSYMLFYDPLVRNIPRPERYQHPDVKSIAIPSLGTLDIEGMAMKYGRKVEDIRGKTDFEIVVDQKTLTDRLAGVLPQLDIDGQIFIVDIRLNELRPKDDFVSRGIQFEHMEQHPLIDPQSYRFFYDTRAKESLKLDTWDLIEMPKHIVVVEIPVSERLDPVLLVKTYDLGMKDFLMKFPPQAMIRAKVLSLKETGLQQRMNENKTRLYREKYLESFRATRNRKRGRSL